MVLVSIMTSSADDMASGADSQMTSRSTSRTVQPMMDDTSCPPGQRGICRQHDGRGKGSEMRDTCSLGFFVGLMRSGSAPALHSATRDRVNLDSISSRGKLSHCASTHQGGCGAALACSR